MKKDVIKDNWNDKIYFDSARLLRNFETVLEQGVSLEKIKEKYPEIIVA